MSDRAIPCWTVICDLCGIDGSAHTEYVGQTDPGYIRDDLADAGWLVRADRIDICDDHSTGWAEELPEGHCWGCTEDDGPTWFGNCEECWEKAMSQ